jgi:hypothetical protein
MDLMIGGRWVTGKSGPMLATLWAMHPGTIDAIAAEASRRVRSATDPTVIRETVMAALHRTLAVAVEAKDARGVAALAKVYLDGSRVGAPRRQELTGKDGAPLGLPTILANLSPPPSVEELEAFARTGELPRRQGAPN